MIHIYWSGELYELLSSKFPIYLCGKSKAIDMKIIILRDLTTFIKVNSWNEMKVKIGFSTGSGC